MEVDWEMELWIPAPYATDDFLEMLSNHEHDQHGGMELEYLVKFCSLAAQSRTMSRKAVNKRGEAANPVEFVECSSMQAHWTRVRVSCCSIFG